MGTAFFLSSLFLISYIIYHMQVGSVHFQGQGTLRIIYFAILISHTILAAMVPPLALITLYRAFLKDFHRHKKIARFTLPIWLYVSVTGVTIFLFLYGFKFS